MIYINYYNEIKETLVKNEIYKKVKDYSKNKSDLNAYFEVGRLIVEAQGGDISYLNSIDKFKPAKYILPVYATKDGFISEIDCDVVRKYC